MAIAPITLTFACYFKKKYFIASILFVISILVKENVAPFWVGVAISAFFFRRYRVALIIVSVSIIYYLLATKLMMPAIVQHENYYCLYRYKRLGNSITDIALSPILQPKVFWPMLFRPSSIYYVILVLLPFILIFPRAIFLAGGAALVLSASALQETEWNSLYLHYQTLPLIGFMVCFAYGYRLLKIPRPDMVSKIYGFGLKLNYRDKHFYFLISSCFLGLLCWVFFAQNFTPYNKVPYIKNKDVSLIIKQIQASVPPSKTISVMPSNLINFFYFRNKIKYSRYKQLGEYVLIEIKRFANSENLALYELLCRSPKYGLRKVINTPLYCFVLFELNKPDAYKPSLISMTQQQWLNCGRELKVNNDVVSARCNFSRDAQNKLFLRLYLKMNKKVESQYAVILSMLINDKHQFWNKRFIGGATVPTAHLSENQVFVWLVPCNVNTDIKSLKLDIRPIELPYKKLESLDIFKYQP